MFVDCVEKKKTIFVVFTSVVSGYENSFVTSQSLRYGDSECGMPNMNQVETDWLIAAAFAFVLFFSCSC